MRLTKEYRYCASCFSQQLDIRHVDMEAYFDGPAIKQENGDYVGIDDLIICENCLKTAGQLVELYPAQELKDENKQLGEALEDKHSEIEELHALISDLEGSYRKVSSDKILKPARKPKFVEIEA